MRALKLGFCIALFFLVVGCAGTYRSYIDMYKFALNPAQDAVLTYNQIIQSEHDFLYVRNGDRPRAALGLMFIEQQQFKWVSGDKAMLVTEHGRIVKTLGLSNDLLFVSNLMNDPIKHKFEDAASWSRVTDWQSGEFGLGIKSRFDVHENQTLSFFNNTIAVTKIVETLIMVDKPAFMRFDEVWQNTFWLDSKTGQVLQSSQQLAPGLEPVELIFISEVARQLKNTGVSIAEDAI